MTGWRARLQGVTLILRDPLVLDRWRWIARRLPPAAPGDRLLDAGCAAGAFALSAARRGFESLGLDVDERTLEKARRRAARFGIERVRFETWDVRRLADRRDLAGRFTVVICCETIEHVLDDAGLMRSLAGCLAPGGSLFLTSPRSDFRPITPGDDAPPSATEDGGHVRRGYLPGDIHRLCGEAGLAVREIGACGGWLSQKITGIYRHAGRLGAIPAGLLIMPLRLLPPLFDGWLTRRLGWPPYTLCLHAVRPGRAA